ncbi:MAG: hypothetical protein Q8P70_01270, partial [bacterium]|nr:hypothetical protein [bacterium]
MVRKILYVVGGVALLFIFLIVAVYILRDLPAFQDREDLYTKWSAREDYQVAARQDGRTEIVNKNVG